MATSDGGVGDGGPAFPVLDYRTPDRVETAQNGMPLRDYFAAKAIAGMMSIPSGDDPGATAAYAYRIADALLAASGNA